MRRLCMICAQAFNRTRKSVIADSNNRLLVDGELIQIVSLDECENNHRMDKREESEEKGRHQI